MKDPVRKRRFPVLSVTLSAVLMVINVALMVFWIVLLSRHSGSGALTFGTVAFALVFMGLSIYLFLSIKERRLYHRQTNFVDSVTHELKSPIASLRLYLETLRMRRLDAEQQAEFYSTMERELARLDALIDQLLEVARLDVIGEQASDLEPVEMEDLLRSASDTVCARHGCVGGEVFHFDLEPAQISASPTVLSMIFGNLLDNAVKYGGEPPLVEVSVRRDASGRVVTRISDNGPGVPPELRKRIFRLFYRGGDERQRRKKGAGLGLYIANTLVRKLHGKLQVHTRGEGGGSAFEVQLPGSGTPCTS